MRTAGIIPVGKLFLFLILASGTHAARLDADTLAMVEAFLKVPTASLPPDSIERFISLESADLPKKLRRPYEAKKLELLTLRNIARSKKKGLLRTPEAGCSAPPENQGRQAGVLKLAGFQEISEEEKLFLEKETSCTEQELVCEFSLTVVVEKKGKQKRWRYFLHENDPVFALVAQFRAGPRKGGTNFFGLSKPSCLH